ncbi:MAG: methyltransferase domain-containing protein [Nitrospiraceae bacterium]
MSTRDVHRFINEQDKATIQNLITRMELRGKDPTFTKLRDAYLDKLPLEPSARVLEIGCGSGVVVRTVARHEGFAGRVTGVDQSPVLIETARRLATEEGVGDRTEFHIGDAHALDYADGSFDAVIAHTLISHVTEPFTVLKEAARVVRPGGIVAIFDGDYGSLTFACPDAELGKAMDEGLVTAVFNNPRVMPNLPHLLRRVRLELVETLPHVHAEIGTGSYFKSFAETYAPLVSRAGLLSAEKVDIWLKEQRRAMEQGTFFAACNYYTYLARRTTAI